MNYLLLLFSVLKHFLPCPYPFYAYDRKFMTYDDDTIDWNTVPPAKMFHIVMQQIVDMRNELKAEFKQEITRLDGRMDEFKQEMKSVKKELKSDIHTLRLEVHQNHTAFMTHIKDHDRRITVLEMAA